MNGVHDVGGMHGFGSPGYEPDADRREYDPAGGAFHADWERTVFGTTMAASLRGLLPANEHRFAIERMDPVRYLEGPYYERWLTATETMLVGSDPVDLASYLDRVAALETGDGNEDPTGPQPDDDGLATLRDRLYAGVDPPPDPEEWAYEVGDAVRVRNVHPAGHTRVPRYVRDERGTVTARRGATDYPDTGERSRDGPVPLYTVGFDAAELWGEDAEEGRIQIDLWEPYLEEP